MVLQHIQKAAAWSIRIQGYISISAGILLFLAGPIAALISKQYLFLILSVIGLFAMLGGWYNLRRANRVEAGYHY